MRSPLAACHRWQVGAWACGGAWLNQRAGSVVLIALLGWPRLPRLRGWPELLAWSDLSDLLGSLVRHGLANQASVRANCRARPASAAVLPATLHRLRHRAVQTANAPHRHSIGPDWLPALRVAGGVGWAVLRLRLPRLLVTTTCALVPVPDVRDGHRRWYRIADPA